MFDFLGHRQADHRTSNGRRRGRGPITIGFEQLEGREMLSSGLAVTIVPAGLPPSTSMPRPIAGSIDPEADGEERAVVRIKPKARGELIAGRWSRPWGLGGRFGSE